MLNVTPEDKNFTVSGRLAAECKTTLWQAKQSLTSWNSDKGEGDGNLVDLITKRGQNGSPNTRKLGNNGGAE